tara:strand:+ start:120 stop:593 length:474 start_codon:yes stop_codon:yes gene_type:complete
MSVKINKGRAGIQIDTDLQQFYTGFLDTVAPNARKVLEDTLKKIEADAIRDWPVRKPIIRKNAEGEVRFFRKTSKGSWKKFERGFRITPGGGFEAFLRNRAPYSWAIKFGVDSENNRGKDIIQPQGKKASQELLIKPHRKAANKIVKALADDLIRRI